MDRGDPFKYRIRFLILSLLAIKPSHGYELGKRIEEITRGLVKGSPGSIYPVLRELKEQGLLEEDLIVEQGRAKKIYRLTEKGAMLLLDELNLFYDIANALIDLTVRAKKSLQNLIEHGYKAEACPDPETIERLENIRNTIDEYLDALKRKMLECGEKQEK